MKKLLVIFILSGILMACNDNGENVETPVDDSTRLPSTVTPADTSTIPLDTTTAPADTVIKK